MAVINDSHDATITIGELTVGKFHWSDKCFQYKP